MVNKLKQLLNISDNTKDQLLLLIIETCTDFVRNYTNSIHTEPLENVILELAVIRYNRIGTEGLQSESYSGVSFSYDDLPISIKSQLDSHRRIKVIC